MPLTGAIRKGDLRGFDRALEAGEPEFVKRRIYLTLERARDICLRNLFRKVFLLGGWEAGKGKEEGKEVRRTRVPLKEFVRAVEVAEQRQEGNEVEREEVECFLANMIFKVSLYSCSRLHVRETNTSIWKLHFIALGRSYHALGIHVPRFMLICAIQNLIKGYISREAATVVLSKTGAFPGTGV